MFKSVVFLLYQSLLTALCFPSLSVCACWARSGERIAAERCWEILQHMEQRVKEGHLKCRPNVRTYNAVIGEFERHNFIIG